MRAHGRASFVRRLAGAIALLSAAAGAVACGGPAMIGDVFVGGEARYRIGDLGPDWRRLELADQNDLAFHHEGMGAIVQVNATCDPNGDVPLTALTNHLLIGFTERDVREQRVVAMDEREALRTHVVARLDGVPRELVFYVLKKDDCVYDFALITPPGESFLRAAPAFERFVGGFSTSVGGGSR